MIHFFCAAPERSFDGNLTMVIKNLPSQLKEENLKKYLKSLKITTKRISIGSHRHRKERMTAFVTVEDLDMITKIDEDSYIKLGFDKYPVERYKKSPVLQCYNCQRYCHLSRLCKNETRCLFCSEKHQAKDCKKMTLRSLNGGIAKKDTWLTIPNAKLW